MVSRGQLGLHRKFGQWGVWLAIAVVAVGIATILVRTRLAFPDATPLMSAVVFVAFDGLSLLLFGALVALAWRYRLRTAIHRRLMVMAMVALLPPAFGRLVAYLRHDHIEIIVLGLMIVTTLTFVAVDAFRSHRIQLASMGARPADPARQRRHVFRAGLDLADVALMFCRPVAD